MKKIFNILIVFVIVLSCLSVSMLFIDRNKNDNDNNNDVITQIDYSILNCAFIGDSITYGTDGENSSQQLEYTYPELVDEIVGFNKVYNYGIGGSTLARNVYYEDNTETCPMCVRVNSLANDIDIIGLMGGVNDFFNSVPLGTITSQDNTTIYGALNIIAETLKSKYDFVFFMTPYKTESFEWVNNAGYTLSAVADAVKNVANKYDIPVLDLFNNGNAEIDLDNTDGTHFSQSFVRNYTAPQIARFIKDNYKK